MNKMKLISLLFATFILFASCTSSAFIFEPSHDPPDTFAGEPGQEEPVVLPAQGPVEVSVQEAILVALQNNKSLHVQKIAPAIRRTSEEQQLAAFDPSLSAGASGSRQRTKSSSSDSRSYSTGADIELSKKLSTGTTLSAGLSTARSWGDLYSDSHSTGVDVSITQALLAGRDARVNLASLRQAKLDTRASQYELRGFAESLVAQVETTYWDYALAKRQIDIYTDSLKLAEQQLSETTERVNVGKLAQTELSAARAQVALRKEDLINARSNLEKLRLRMLQLLNPPGDNIWERDVTLRNKPAVPEVKLDDVEEHVRISLLMRSDLNQARLSLKRGELEVFKTANGLLPRLDLFISLGKTGYAKSFYGSVNGFNRGSYDYSVGLNFEFPLGNRAARASHRKAVLSQKQAKESLENLKQLVVLDVRSAYIEVNRAREQEKATAATRKLQEETLRSEIEKFRVGKSTSYLVAQAQRDLVASQVSEIQATVAYLKALVELFKVEGSLLERRGLAAPGRDPVEMPGR